MAATQAAADAVEGRVRAILRASRRRKQPSARLIFGIEAGLVGALGAVLGWNFWLGLGPVVEPAPPAVVAAPIAAPSAAPNNPFRISSAPEVAAPGGLDAPVAETTLSIALHGTWVNSDGGVAIIQTADQKQGRFVPGDVIADGVTLDAVLADQVILLRGGVRESLRLVNREATAQAAAPPGAGATPQPASDGLAGIGNVVVARPQADAVGNLTLVLQPAGDIEQFDALGLEPGDRLVAVDNQLIGTDIASGLEALAMTRGAPSVTISIEREGVVMPVRIPLSKAAGAQ